MQMPSGMMDKELQEVLKLLEQKTAQADSLQGEAEELPLRSKEELLSELMANDNPDEVLTGEQAAMYEFSMMMKQFEAMAQEYERLEAEEAEENA